MRQTASDSRAWSTRLLPAGTCESSSAAEQLGAALFQASLQYVNKLSVNKKHGSHSICCYANIFIPCTSLVTAEAAAAVPARRPASNIAVMQCVSVHNSQSNTPLICPKCSCNSGLSQLANACHLPVFANTFITQGGCPEDTVDAATLATGYKWVADSLRITEANEPLLSLTCHNAAYWDEHNAHALRQVWTAQLVASSSLQAACMCTVMVCIGTCC
jgi:hypothetical protein